ncbi:MAG: methyltransferase [Acidimicrobiales bacterium]|nr:methyltransferase [Acidimicrobiales bacterium]
MSATHLTVIPPVIDVHLSATDLRRALRRDVTDGLGATPRTLPPKWFYDDRGSELFDEITRLPEYYPTAREREILRREAASIAAASRADTLVELGSGTSDKTRTLLDALAAGGRLRRFVPFDVSEGILRWAAAAIAERHPGIEVHGVVGDFEHHLGQLPRGGRRLIAFLGGTIGNLEPPLRARFLADLAATMAPGDSLLLGTDLVKDPARLIAAYDDAQGVTAAFNRNVLTVLDRELHADFDPCRWQHVARWDADQEWIEMRLRSVGDQQVRIADLDLDLSFADGEEIRTEISAKFRRARVADELTAAGLALQHWWTDAAGDFALSLSTR